MKQIPVLNVHKEMVPHGVTVNASGLMENVFLKVSGNFWSVGVLEPHKWQLDLLVPTSLLSTSGRPKPLAVQVTVSGQG